MASFTQIFQQKALLVWLPTLLLLSCRQPGEQQDKAPETGILLVVLGIAQDGGYPQAGCDKACCRPVWEGQQQPRRVVSLGLVDNISSRVYLFDATPDFRSQLHDLLGYLPAGQRNVQNLGGIFLTHAHTGHYTGLMHLGREAMGARQVAVYAMPRIQAFLQAIGPWSQLVALQNIVLRPLRPDSS
ncbi:MAG TPA: pyrroloquinoline quinone biosynthesis protein PqqB, partial [Flammeovirgaceae bacterium]|nr:pyrroloquinoline quinone biosynthesis protein PqqB [Flammeovirgaceae bacterium]